MDKKGFIAVFKRQLDRTLLHQCFTSWLERFERVEQIVPHALSTVVILAPEEILWYPHLQLRITNGDQFAWVYTSPGSLTMETTGFQDAEISFCLEVLLELPELQEVIDEKNQRRLDGLEREGILQ